MKTTALFVSGGLVAAATYYITALVQVLFHRWFGHKPRIAKIHQHHVTGHHATYSGHHLLSDQWQASERHVVWYYALPLAPIAALAGWWLPPALFAVHLLSLAFAVWIHLWLHQQYHLRHTPLNRFGWFRRKQRLHLVHHQQGVRNYAIIEYKFDRLMGTFADRPLTSSVDSTTAPR